MRATRTGIGTALREARESRGISLQKASRETRIHGDYLTALERESYESLRADVYVRGFLRSYSSYLGLDPDKVMAFYDRRGGPSPAEPPAPVPGMARRDLGVPRRGASWRLAVGLAVVLLAVFGAVGLLNASGGAPKTPAAGLPPATPGRVTAASQVTVRLSPIHITYAHVIADGVRKFSGVLPLGKRQTFKARSLVRLELNHGGDVEVIVNGHDLGRIGDPDAPYRASFAPTDFETGASPSANG